MRKLDGTTSLNIDDVVKNKNLRENHLHDIWCQHIQSKAYFLAFDVAFQNAEDCILTVQYKKKKKRHYH